MNKIYGEEYHGDSQFVAKCRKLQSIYRVEIGEKIRPYKSRDGQIRFYGNYINDGENPKIGCWKNFLTEYAFNYAIERVNNKRIYETIDPDRLFNNLLSSQPMAFNLFCSLKQMLEEAPQITSKIIAKALPYYDIHTVTGIDLEFIPEKYKELTGDKSAMDAIIRFEDCIGTKGFIAIENKYSEKLGTNIASKREKSIDAIKKLQCFKPDVEERINCGEIRLTQIYRNFLLSEMYGLTEKQKSYSIILAPQMHPSTEKELKSLLNELRQEYKQKIRNVHLEDFVNVIIRNSPDKYRNVFERFYDRYLNFDKLKLIGK